MVSKLQCWHMKNKLQEAKISNRERIIKMTYKARATHLGSALSCVDIIEAVYQIKRKEERFILSAGHAASALYAVLENHGYILRPNLAQLGVHPNRNLKIDIPVSTGSLGQGLPIAVGIALANRKYHVYCCISDGECAEGSISEALKIGSENSLKNLIILVNANGYAAYRKTHVKRLEFEFLSYGWDVIKVPGHNIKKIKKAIQTPKLRPTVIIALTKVNHFPFLKGLDAHYYKMNKDDYLLALKTLKYGKISN